MVAIKRTGPGLDAPSQALATKSEPTESSVPAGPVPIAVTPAAASVPTSLAKGVGLVVDTGTGNVTSAGNTGAAASARAGQALAGASQESTAAEAKAEAKAPPEPAPETSAQDSQRAADVLRQFRMQLNPGLKTAVIQLAPAELGKIRIEMKLEGGEVRALVRAEKPEALAALEAHLPELRAALEQQGLVADDLQLGLGFEDDGGRDAQGSGSAAKAATVAEPETDHRSLARAVARRAGVDFYA